MSLNIFYEIMSHIRLNLQRKVMTIRTFLKNIFLNVCPDNILQAAKKVHYARKLRLAPEIAEPDMGMIKYLVYPGDYVVDIGSNIGVYTKHLSDLVGLHGRVYSIEPVPHTFKILLSNVKKLGLRNVELVNYAISNMNRTLFMEVPLYKSGGENFYRAKIVYGISKNKLRRIKVNSVTLDNLFSNKLHPISFIKCDVEGHEIQCIKGAGEVIKRSRPAWLIEVSGNPDDHSSSAYETFGLLKENGYECFWFDGKGLKRRQVGIKCINYFFLTRKHLESLETSELFTFDR